MQSHHYPAVWLILTCLLIATTCLTSHAWKSTSLTTTAQMMHHAPHAWSAGPCCDKTIQRCTSASVRKKLSGILLAAQVLLLASTASQPVMAVSEEEALRQLYSLPAAQVTFQYPDSMKDSPKLIKTHNKEVFLKSSSIKGFNAGLTVSTLLWTSPPHHHAEGCCI